jgi:hypothetical protein
MPFRVSAVDRVVGAELSVVRQLWLQREPSNCLTARETVFRRGLSGLTRKTDRPTRQAVWLSDTIRFAALHRSSRTQHGIQLTGLVHYDRSRRARRRAVAPLAVHPTGTTNCHGAGGHSVGFDRLRRRIMAPLAKTATHTRRTHGLSAILTHVQHPLRCRRPQTD